VAARDVIFLGVFLFASAVILLVSSMVWDKIGDAYLDNPVMNSSAGVRSAVAGVDVAFTKVDWIVMGVFVGSVLGIMITGWLVGGHPIFMFAYFIMVVMAVVGSAILSNVWESLFLPGLFGAGVVAALPITDFVMDNLPILISVVGLLGMVVMFAKPNEGENVI
jgi:hypothetical protein